MSNDEGLMTKECRNPKPESSRSLSGGSPLWETFRGSCVLAASLIALVLSLPSSEEALLAAPPAIPMATPAQLPAAVSGQDVQASQTSHISKHLPSTSDVALASVLESRQPDFLGDFDVRDMAIRTVLCSVLMIGVCFASLLLLKQWTGNRAAVHACGRRIKVIETLSLAQRCQLQLIQVDDQKVLVGFDPAGLKAVLPMSSFASELRDFESVAPSRFRGLGADIVQHDLSIQDSVEPFYGQPDPIGFPGSR